MKKTSKVSFLLSSNYSNALITVRLDVFSIPDAISWFTSTFGEFMSNQIITVTISI